MTISKTAAIRKARLAVGSPIRASSTCYFVLGPHRVTEPDGPTTQTDYDSIKKARRARAAWVAYVALALMGRLTEDARYAIDRAESDPYAAHDVESLVDAGLAA